MSIASTTHGEYVLPTPAENLSRQASQRSITSVTSRPSLRSYGGSPQAETGSQQSARSRHSSRASVASQQSINEGELRFYKSEVFIKRINPQQAADCCKYSAQVDYELVAS